jgi:hypothetical protein
LLNALAPGDAEITYLPAAVSGKNYALVPAGPARAWLPRLRAALPPAVHVVKTGAAFARRRPRLALAALAASMLGGLFFVLMVALVFSSRGKPIDSAKLGKDKPAPTVPEQETPTMPEEAFLSDLKEVSTTGVAFGKDGHLGHNGFGNIGGNPKEIRIIVKGVLARKGLSTLTSTGGAASVTYKLDKQYRRLRSGVGLHARGWFSGSKITFVVLGDGRVLWRSKEIGSLEDYPFECDVDITGVDQLELQVTCTDNSNGVWPVWIDPRVTK